MLLSHQYYWCSSPAMALFAQQGNFDTFLHFLSAFIVRYAEAGCRCAPHGRRVKTGEPARRHRHQRQLTLLYSSRAVTLLLKRFPDSILCYAASWTMYCSQSPPPPLHKRFPDSAQVCSLHLARAVWWQCIESLLLFPHLKLWAFGHFWVLFSLLSFFWESFNRFSN